MSLNETATAFAKEYNAKMNAICDAIRSKTGKENKLSLPEIVAEINTINVTGEPFPLDLNDIENLISWQKSISIGMFKGSPNLASVTFWNATYTGQEAFAYCPALVSGYFPKAIQISPHSFNGSQKLSDLYCPEVTLINSSGLYACNSLKRVNFPKVKAIAGSAFSHCGNLTKADFTVVESINVTAFYNCLSLTALILRGSKVAQLSSLNAFTGTPIEKGYGYIYVPSSLVNSYKSATNWSVYASRIRAIEDYPEITGG